MLKRLKPGDVGKRRRMAVDLDTLRAASTIVTDVRTRGEKALYNHAKRLGDIQEGDPLVMGREGLKSALDSLPVDQVGVLERTADRIRRFAEAQRKSLSDLEIKTEGGSAGHHVTPVGRAGCYAPGGRFPLPSSVLMTAVTAKVAGVKEIWVASPRPAPATMAAAAIAGADALLCVGGAQAIAALAYGAGQVPRVDVIAGPGNRWVTAAKKLVYGDVGIDMLAGPSELVVLADSSVDPAVVAADLLAQAEHDPDALPILVALDGGVADAVDAELERQLAVLPTAATAGKAVRNGYAVAVMDLDEAVGICDSIAPEHLELHIRNAGGAAGRFSNYGSLFIGEGSAEVLGDYGAGPNHVLPTGGTARFYGGLSVLTFLRFRTWLKVDELEAGAVLVKDAVSLARMEGLEAHARSADKRKK
jgi:phosphoribosyl-ATP pyrophosphohydrolase/phosphoribosyl-AMP cyclohydrolase/histidinol dehydrogenase